MDDERFNALVQNIMGTLHDQQSMIANHQSRIDQALANHHEAINQAVNQANQPKTIERGPDGRAVSVGGRPVVRGPDGKIIGIH